MKVNLYQHLRDNGQLKTCKLQFCLCAKIECAKKGYILNLRSEGVFFCFCLLGHQTLINQSVVISQYCVPLFLFILEILSRILLLQFWNIYVQEYCAFEFYFLFNLYIIYDVLLLLVYNNINFFFFSLSMVNSHCVYTHVFLRLILISFVTRNFYAFLLLLFCIIEIFISTERFFWNFLINYLKQQVTTITSKQLIKQNSFIFNASKLIII
eukprot:TRINITY_DN341_c0_g1_i5.p1 TRINITY_DN341_c0_g1~~TRINITY_DN341_c0_g1_i5.p1  ORF type:complete len:211 (-),score=-12.44 TRINITY_DN341_c0_g1_i5:368-1000(-)